MHPALVIRDVLVRQYGEDRVATEQEFMDAWRKWNTSLVARVHGHVIYALNQERYAIATRQMADWWWTGKPSSRTPFEVSDMVIKTPSRNYIQQLVG